MRRHGHDSLAPFVIRPDKSFHFAGSGVLAYRVLGRTAVVSGDPIGPEGAASRVLTSFMALARRQGWRTVLWAASDRHLAAYRGLGFRALRAGEEAFVDPQQFTLGGRQVRKLRQSVNRLERRGWAVEVCEGADVDPILKTELDSFEASWKSEQACLLGFAMGFGAFDPEVNHDDLYVLGRSPEGDLRAVMRFVAHCGKLSLDTMHRVGETPNGLNEALVCRALELARRGGVPEVSLNYAGLAHLVRDPGNTRTSRALRSVLLSVLRQRFQMETLVRFNDKFSPDWRPRFLLYQSRRGLPGAVLRVLQAEGYLPAPPPSRPSVSSDLPCRTLAEAGRGDDGT